MIHIHRASGRYLSVCAGILILALLGGSGTIQQGDGTFLHSEVFAGIACSQQHPPERIILNLTQQPWSSQAVTWRTMSEVSSPRAQIARATESSDWIETAQTIQADKEPVVIHDSKTAYHYSAIFDSLSPNTLYAYRVGDGKHWSEWNQFKTAGKAPAPFKFVYFGDPQEEVLSMCSRIFRTAYQTAPDAAFWLFAGDLVDHGDRDAEWAGLFDALGWIPRTTPMMMLPGNHEYPDKRTIRGSDLKIFPLWRPHFTLPENAPEGLKETVYFIDYQGVRLVMLNGNEQLEKQAAWLDGVLSENPQRWTIAAIHQPVYSAAERRKAKADSPLNHLFVPVFDKYSVDLVLQGHDHVYSRSARLKNSIRVPDAEKGTVYVISVCGPKFYESDNTRQDIMDKTGTGRQLFQVIRVDENRLQYESYDARGEIYDSFVLEKERTDGANNGDCGSNRGAEKR